MTTSKANIRMTTRPTSTPKVEDSRVTRKTQAAKMRIKIPGRLTFKTHQAVLVKATIRLLEATINPMEAQTPAPANMTRTRTYELPWPRAGATTREANTLLENLLASKVGTPTYWMQQG
jgi:hypothetical protein